MNSNVELVDGVYVTKCDFPPPGEEWTDNYEAMGGDEYWSEGGRVAEILESRGLTGDIKPFFAMDAESGRPFTLFELGGKHYFFNASDDSVQRITYPNNLAEIIGYIGDPDGGLSDLVYDDI